MMSALSTQCVCCGRRFEPRGEAIVQAQLCWPCEQEYHTATLLLGEHYAKIGMQRQAEQHRKTMRGQP